MNHPPDRLTDELITEFLRTRSADPEFGLLSDIMRTVEAAPQERPWLGLPPIRLARRTFLIVAIALLLATMGAIGVGSGLLQETCRSRPCLPTSSSWERVLIETPSGTGSVVSLAASPFGLAAIVGELGGDGPTQLVVSTDGRNWTLVPDGQHPRPGLITPSSFGYPSVVGTDRGFLLLQLSEVWMSENGYDWRRLAGQDSDPDLRMGGPGSWAATAGGPGLVAVGGDKAWYSVDGSDWSLAEAPPLPAQILEIPEDTRIIDLIGVAAAGDKLVAWGRATGYNESIVVPMLWASNDGRTWANAIDPRMDSLTALTGGPGGFVAAGETHDSETGFRDATWFSADGGAWEKVEVLDSRLSEDNNGTLVNDEGMRDKLTTKSAAAAKAGYVLVGGDGLCLLFGESCPSAEAAIWTSPDGRSWSRLPSDDLFRVTEPGDPANTTGAWANRIVAWGSRFVVGGEYDGRPVIWISDSAHPD